MATAARLVPGISGAHGSERSVRNHRDLLLDLRGPRVLHVPPRQMEKQGGVKLTSPSETPAHTVPEAPRPHPALAPRAAANTDRAEAPAPAEPRRLVPKR